MAIFGWMGLKTTIYKPDSSNRAGPVKSGCRSSLYELGIEAFRRRHQTPFTIAQRTAVFPKY